MLKNIFLTVFALFIVFGMCITAVAVEAVLGLCDVFMWCAEKANNSLWKAKQKFKKTSEPVAGFLTRIKNMVMSRYELSFKQESLFHVGIKTDKDAVVKYSYMVGTVRRGSFDFEIEPIKYDHTTCIEKIELSHMNLPAKTIYGPIHMMYADVLKLTYGKTLYHSPD